MACGLPSCGWVYDLDWVGTRYMTDDALAKMREGLVDIRKARKRFDGRVGRCKHLGRRIRAELDKEVAEDGG